MAADAREKNLQAVRRLCEQWPWMNREDYRALFAEGSVYVNVPKPELRRIGPDETWEALKDVHTRTNLTLEVLSIQGDDTSVLTERLERFERKADGRVIDLYVMGAFDMKDGKITGWRDYFEWGQLFPPEGA